MSKLILLLISLLFTVSFSYGRMSFQYGTTHATMMNNYGQIYVPCRGVIGTPRYHFGGMPGDWKQEGNYIMVPNIFSIHSTFIIKVRVQDENNNVL